ncbi:hypothetical protein LGV61_04080 [Desulfurispirillum indicum]|uniref:chemotaxis protein CheB n=1 Tax=Desulfurispirillum indicum TaxID=936456 RepID=UPI001CF98D0D|nr:chemotaxis protein CheB [Desulfurispirillum indicum]UCZ57463.1 hypothetical protein LGV61_04080 [Desulfurispirillum indicum]
MERSAGARKSGKSTLIVVGVGASAGGLEALKLFVAHLPPQAPIAYVIVQHLSPTYRTMLVSLLGKDSTIEVGEAAHGERLSQGRIYITPPNHDITLRKNRIQLHLPGAHSVGPRPSVDLFLQSLAQEFGNHAIGVILSGTGSDGSVGVRAIKAGGGITIAQQPDTAKYDGMPTNAIATGHIDIILPPEAIGQELVEIFRISGEVALPPRSRKAPSDMEQIFQQLLQHSGVDFTHYKLSTINRRLERRMAALKISSLGSYVKHLAQCEGEQEKLFRDMLISVTSFFRDSQAFAALEDVMADLLKKQAPGAPIRVWVPGCSTGEEAYSIAMVICNILGGDHRKSQVQIFATDIDQDALVIARRGHYAHVQLAAMDGDMVNRYFISRGASLEVSKTIREMVVFSRHDIIKDPPFLRMNLVSCRNLLVSLNQPLQRKTLALFSYALNPSGVLFTGKSESLSAFDDLFEPLDRENNIYRRIHGARVAPYGRLMAGALLRQQTRPQPPVRTAQSLEDHVKDAVMRSMMHKWLLLDHDLNIVHVQGDVSHYISIRHGDFSGNILGMLRKELRNDLRLAMSRVRKSQHPFSGRTTLLPLSQAEAISMRIKVIPVLRENHWQYLLWFDEDEGIVSRHGVANLPGDGNELDAELVREMQDELISVREHLQTVIEELETPNEELQSLNEELQSSNEELQASNEELETTNEELQSTHAELKAIHNEKERHRLQLLEKTRELEKSRSIISRNRMRLSMAQRIAQVGGWEMEPASMQLHLTREHQELLGMVTKGDTLTLELDEYIRKHIHPDDWSRYRSHMQAAARQASQVDYHGELEYRALRCDKQMIHLHDHVIGFRDSSAALPSIFGATRDISRHKETEIMLLESRNRSELANRVKSQFMANMSHELRTPLNAIIGYSEMLQEEYRSDPQGQIYQDMERVQKAGRQLLQIINDILDMADLESQTAQLQAESFDICSEARQVAQSVQAAIHKNGNTLDVRCDENIGTMYSDRQKIRQVLIHLLNNAGRFTENGQVALTVSAEQRHSEPWVLLRVRDTGIGIDPSIHEQIFEPFTLGDSSSTRLYGGSGLGLSISRRFCEMMGGAITLQSETGKGAEFTVALPLNLP